MKAQFILALFVIFGTVKTFAENQYSAPKIELKNVEVPAPSPQKTEWDSSASYEVQDSKQDERQLASEINSSEQSPNRDPSSSSSKVVPVANEKPKSWKYSPPIIEKNKN